ncbi:beta-glucosidase [Paenibacillus endophyticus]|uniref:Beta-glucosidase n=1 Tax=Paenibacillus endophyticus TaxID=1294268 RepID=A0A7W5CA90_9BACL|nr:GH1 family beta-glucosidase [Paenibacillus endophyticus]MBB3153004.1 beta-glucosidase [Paenibacillus endophyticus]
MTTVQFPKDFKWGTATAAYQIEGAFDEEGRSASIWDTFAKTPGKVLNGDNGDVACDSYHRVDDDIRLLKELGVSVYRFSIAWPRVIPQGRGDVNPTGLDYYEELIDKLIANGIEPFVTLYHWDLPQTLQDEGGWENRATMDAFVQYAETVFRKFNGKVKRWITLNEPWCISILSNYLGAHAPGKQDMQAALDVAHHILVAHGLTVKRFRELGIEGEIGYAPNTEWRTAYSSSPEDVKAAQLRNGSFNEWFLSPVLKGEYPRLLTDWYESKGFKVKVEPGDMAIISQPIDFLGINYYTGSLIRHAAGNDMYDSEEISSSFAKTDFDWNIYADGFYHVLTWITETYGQIPIYITENGACYEAELQDGKINDEARISFLRDHIMALHRAIASGVPVKGYMVWSLMDNFEWAFGYSKPFGLVHVNFNTLERTPKASYHWYSQLVAANQLEI